jgi:hypothetical protein
MVSKGVAGTAAAAKPLGLLLSLAALYGVDLAVEQDCGGSVSGSQRRLALRLAEERVTLDARGGSLA